MPRRACRSGRGSMMPPPKAASELAQVDGSRIDLRSLSLENLRWQYAEVAQLVEQLIRNQQVDGSNPFLGSKRDGPNTGPSLFAFWSDSIVAD